MSKYTTQTEAQLAEFAASFYDDPYGFVMAAYPWGEPKLADGSPNPLAKRDGPENWQRELLQALGNHIRENGELVKLGLDMKVWKSARASGHGVGKSALVAWLVQFYMTTRADTRGVVTASTLAQLTDKTWPELAKWHKLFLFKHWFTWTSTSYYFSQYPDEQRKNYMTTATTVSKDNTEAFAGLHNEGKTVFVLFDEASGVDDEIWPIAEGALTDGEGFFLAFGNPTRPDGRFADCFDRYAEMYDIAHIDSRDVSHTNKQHLRDLIRQYGADSDIVKVRVYGQFPLQSFNGFISADIVNDAMQRELFSDSGAPLIMAVDVARFGDDEIVIGLRQGRDYRSRKVMVFNKLPITRLADICADVAAREKPDAIVIESTGPGAGLIDILRDRHFKVVEVHPGSPSSKPEHYVNKRAELWGLMRDWLADEGCINEDEVLFQQLTKIQYTLDRHEQRIRLEGKEDYKKRTGLKSPDRADTLALTFGVRLARRDTNLRRAASKQGAERAITEYDPITF